MRIVICNFGPPRGGEDDYDRFWRETPIPPQEQSLSLFDYQVDWGFHLYALGVYLRDIGIASRIEFWNFADPDATTPATARGVSWHYMGVLRVNFANAEDAFAYIRRTGAPDLIVNHGRHGMPILEHLEGRCFRVHVAALRAGLPDTSNHGAECYLVDSTEFLDHRSMLYIPVVNTRRIAPNGARKVRDFVYLAWPHPEKRHDIVIDAVRRSHLHGHFHPVEEDELDLSGVAITRSALNTVDLVDLLATSRIAVYPGDRTSNPAAMWECVAAGLPLVMNEDMLGGHHLIVPGVTGEFANEGNFGEVMERVVANCDRYRARRHFEEHWDTETLLAGYVDFFRRHGWTG